MMYLQKLILVITVLSHAIPYALSTRNSEEVNADQDQKVGMVVVGREDAVRDFDVNVKHSNINGAKVAKVAKKSSKSKKSKIHGNKAEMNRCKEYCSLFSQAQNRCPYASNGHGASQTEDCITSCLEASFSHDGTDQDFDLSDTIQCRMNHAKMAIKEGALTNAQHCLHATIPGPQRCIEDDEAIRNSKMMEAGKTYFYYISASLQAVGSDSSKVSQIFLLSISYLIVLRGRLYVAYPSLEKLSTSYKAMIDCTSDSAKKYRSADGTCNSLKLPSMGAAQTHFVRSLKPSRPHPNGNADITAIANIMKRPHGTQHPETFESFNQLASAWIQFNLHDWFQHDSDEDSHDGVLRNRVTHWWDASQIYGSSAEEEAAIRLEDGKIHLDENDELDYDSDGTPRTGFGDNFWAGLHIFHTLFAREHNYIVDKLSTAYPAMSNNEKYGAARLCISAILAKIHTVEWTPALLDNAVSTFALNVNWYGLKPAASKFFSEEELKPIGDTINNFRLPSIMNGQFNTSLTMYNSPFYMSEEFVAVYRMHPFLPDEIEVGDKTLTLNELSFKDARTLVGTNTTKTFLEAFAKTKARTLSLRNYPYELYALDIPGRSEKMNLAEIELARDRDRNLPRYNDARRQLLLQPYASLQDLTDNEEDLALLESVYDDIDQVDFMVGCLVDKERPEGFAFGIVPYHIFVVMASARIFSDRFFQEGFTAEYYTEWGLNYVATESFQSILIRQFPELSKVVPENPFLNDWKW